MNNKKSGIILGIITVLVTRIFLSLIGVNNISTIIAVILLITSSIVFAVFMIKERHKNKLGSKLSIIASILMLIMCFCISLSSIMIDCYPKLSQEHEALDITITFSSFASFIAFVIFWIVVGNKIMKKNQE